MSAVSQVALYFVYVAIAALGAAYLQVRTTCAWVSVGTTTAVGILWHYPDWHRPCKKFSSTIIFIIRMTPFALPFTPQASFWMWTGTRQTRKLRQLYLGAVLRQVGHPPERFHRCFIEGLCEQDLKLMGTFDLLVAGCRVL